MANLSFRRRATHTSRCCLESGNKYSNINTTRNNNEKKYYYINSVNNNNDDDDDNNNNNKKKKMKMKNSNMELIQAYN